MPMPAEPPPTDHAALMDRVYRRQRYVYDFTRKYYLFGRDRLIGELALKPGDRLVEIGCGTARNLVRIARLYPGAELYGLDASQEMLKSAAESVAHAGLEGRVRLIHGYAEDLSPALFGDNRPFDRAVFSYSLSMIPDWRRALAAAGDALSDAGKVHAVDFGDLSGLGRLGASCLRAWLALFHVKPRVEILQGVERMTPGGRPGQGELWVSPARYAFLWTPSKTRALAFATADVADR
ncbi:MAG: class I SAM-dependent methyltransferase [Rhizomicrobium sp.]|jgi:S-adenosylmethionine-diacylgycerolhomoserine-N-methlytransferase